MNITFKRDLSHSYMVLTGQMKPDAHEEQMLSCNEIPGLLPYHTGAVDGQTQYWYDITGKRTLRDFFSQEKVTRKNLTGVFRQLQQVSRSVGDYLIRQDHLLYTADGIFVAHSGDGDRIYLCYCPLQDKNIHNEFLTVTEHLIAEVNHEDEALCKVCYDLYEASLHEDFSFVSAYELVRSLEPQETVVAEYSDRCIQIHRVEDEADEPEEAEEELYEEEEPEPLLDLLWKKLVAWKEELFSGAVKKRKELFPLPSEEADFVFDAEIVCEPRTQMLADIKQPAVTRLVYEGKGKAPEIVLEGDAITIGSKVGENTVVLPFPGVSRYHARIRKSSEGFQIQDLNSTNGTFCNGQILSYNEPYTLQHMDQIMFADVTYRVV